LALLLPVITAINNVVLLYSVVPSMVKVANLPGCCQWCMLHALHDWQSDGIGLKQVGNLVTTWGPPNQAKLAYRRICVTGSMNNTRSRFVVEHVIITRMNFDHNCTTTIFLTFGCGPF
jgi:hypothetical protein